VLSRRIRSPKNLPLRLVLVLDVLRHALVDLSEVDDDLGVELVDEDGGDDYQNGREVLFPMDSHISLYARQDGSVEEPA